MKNLKFRVKKVTAPKITGNAETSIPSILVLAPENGEEHRWQGKLEVAADGKFIADEKDYARGDIFEVSIRRISKVKEENPAGREKRALAAASEKAKKESENTKEEGGEESEEESDVSSGGSASDAIEKIQTMEDPDEIKSFVKGEDRSTITDAAKARIKELKKGDQE